MLLQLDFVRRNKTIHWIFFSSLLATGYSLLVSGCGWRLRGSYDFPSSMERVYVKGTGRYSDLGSLVHDALLGTNARPVSQVDNATAILQILSNKSEQRILATDSSGRASEYEISYQLGFRVTDSKGIALVQDQTITTRREYRFDPSNVLATGDEVEQLKQDMLRSAVQQMLRRINATLISQ